MPVSVRLPFLLLIFALLITSSVQAETCSSSYCLNSIETFCNHGYCQCMSARIFDCSITGEHLPVGRSTFNITEGQPKYFILLQNTIDEDLQYRIILQDYSQSSISTAYDIAIYIDNGIGQSRTHPRGYIQETTYRAEIRLSTRLENIDSTMIPQQLILNISYLPSGTSSLVIDYDYSVYSWGKVLLIIGYVTGAILVVITMALCIAVMKRNRRDEDERSERREKREFKERDISHFNGLMPISSITPRDKQDGAVCSVCLGEFDFNSAVRKTLCNHLFHASCIDEWAHKNLSCPICRKDLSRRGILDVIREQSKIQNQNWIVNSIDFSDEDEGEEGEEGEEGQGQGQGQSSGESSSNRYANRQLQLVLEGRNQSPRVNLRQSLAYRSGSDGI